MQVSRGATQRYSAGNKVYGAGRSNPTSGTVDPTGYVDRGFNNAASQRRSGLAQAAFSRLSGMGDAPSVGGALPTVQNVDQRQALINQNLSGANPVGGAPLQTSPEGHYLPAGAMQQPQQNQPLDLQSAILRRLQGGLNGAS